MASTTSVSPGESGPPRSPRAGAGTPTPLSGYYEVPASLPDGLQALETWVERYKRGEVSHAKFRGFRVPLGVYEQRTRNTFMMRIRLPGGAVTPAQLKGLARVARRYAVRLHVTTRQDMQLQNVTLDDIVPLYRGLHALGLTCQGGGGNTVRNIMACPDAGVCPRETFNVLPYAVALTEYLLAFSSSYNLPRKFKLAFSGCPEDGGWATLNDLGFVAARRNGEPGFIVYAGGGMGAYSAVGVKLHDFIPVAEVGYVAEAVKRLFDRLGDRRRKHQARLRFVVKRLGVEQFREEYAQELARVKAECPVTLHLHTAEEQPSGPVNIPAETPVDDGFQAWRALRVREQRQPGFLQVRLPLPLGDLDPDRLEALAVLAERVGEGALRATPTQDLLFRWVRVEELVYLYNRLRSLGLAAVAPQNLSRLVCCKGAATCKQGLCLSTGVTEAVAAELDRAGVRLEELPEVRVLISGCPNACGHHPSATLGLYGIARRIDDRPVPFYEVLAGGRMENGVRVLAEPRGAVPAKNVPALVRDFLVRYHERHDEFDGFFAFLQTEGDAWLDELVHRYGSVPSYEDNPEFYRDFGREEDFSLAGRGPGECGAGVFDMIESDLEEARCAWTAWQEQDDTAPLYHAAASLARSLLVLRGVDPDTREEALTAFEELFVATGWVARRYKFLVKAAHTFAATGNEAPLREVAEWIPALTERIETLYRSIDADLQFRVDREEDPTPAAAEAAEEITELDLRGIRCPLNYVRARIMLEEMNPGAVLELRLDDGEPIRNVPASLENDGQEILEMASENGHYRLRVRKRA